MFSKSQFCDESLPQSVIKSYLSLENLKSHFKYSSFGIDSILDFGGESLPVFNVLSIIFLPRENFNLRIILSVGHDINIKSAIVAGFLVTFESEFTDSLSYLSDELINIAELLSFVRVIDIN
jgi:hypothetical protein